MCGIAGIVNLNGAPVDRAILEEMVHIQRHRGPDDSGILCRGYLGAGHARLSIIDLSQDAHQPMMSDDGKRCIIYNGEIYNYLELRRELEGSGCRFKSHSDTEVILRSYERWGEACLGRFNGMWSFAIFDLSAGSVFCSRDRFGVKPFYYYLDKDVFVFASEIKALLAHPALVRRPNDRAVYQYLAPGYGYMDTSDETFFEGIKQLKPGHYLTLSAGEKSVRQARYWDLLPDARKVPSSEAMVLDEFTVLFEDAIRLRLRSDVPLGVALSGGLDSSSITCVASRLLGEATLESFSSCFEEKEYDEREYIAPVLESTGARSNLIFSKPNDLFKELEEIIWHQDEPYSTLSIFPQWYVMKLARARGVKVLLTGQGGDETLAGYHKYYFYCFADLIKSLRWKKAHDEISAFRRLKGDAVNVTGPVAKILASYMVPEAVKGLMPKNISDAAKTYLAADFLAEHRERYVMERRFPGILNNDLYNAMRVSPLPSLLHIDDRSSMAHSVESRAPFLDYRLVEFLFSLGPEFKIRSGTTKYILREAMRGVLPEKVRMRRDKMGFATPMDRWFSKELKGKVEEIIRSKEFSSRPYFNQEGIQKTFREFSSGRISEGQYTVWSWVNLELWFRKFIDV